MFNDCCAEEQIRYNRIHRANYIPWNKDTSTIYIIFQMVWRGPNVRGIALHLFGYSLKIDCVTSITWQLFWYSLIINCINSIEACLVPTYTTTRLSSIIECRIKKPCASMTWNIITSIMLIGSHSHRFVYVCIYNVLNFSMTHIKMQKHMNYVKGSESR